MISFMLWMWLVGVVYIYGSIKHDNEEINFTTKDILLLWLWPVSLPLLVLWEYTFKETEL